MLKIKNIPIKNTAELLERAIDIADSFGFIKLEDSLSKLASKRLRAADKVLHAHTRERSLLPIMRKLATKNVQDSEDHILGYDITQDKKNSDSFSLNIAGTENPVAEATLIAAAYTLLNDIGIKDTVVHVNSLGTTESFTRYMRDLTKHLRKIAKDTPLQVRADLAVSPMRAYARLCNMQNNLVNNCPRAIDYLNDDGRSHLWGLLEYLECAGIPYALDNSVVGSGDFYEQTLFELKGGGTTLAHGGRYSALGRKAFKKHIPVAGITIDVQSSGARKPKNTSFPTPQFYFAQIGDGAKKLGVKVLGILHNAGIKVGHSLTQEQLTKQMSYSLAKEAPHVIIIGQKEALTDSVIVRDTATHKQVVMPTGKLIAHLKKLQR